MKKLIGKKRKRETSCFFPEKLFNILKNKNNHSIINWDKTNLYNSSIISRKHFKFKQNETERYFMQRKIRQSERHFRLQH